MLWPLCPNLSSGPMEWMDDTPPSAGRRSLMKTASLGSITAERSFMKTTVCCQGKGITLSDCLLNFAINLIWTTSFIKMNGFWGRVCQTIPSHMLFILYVDRYQNSDTEYETPKGYHHPDSYYDDDEQPLYRDSRRSPKRRLLPATPQGILPSSCSNSCWKIQ